MSNDEDPTWLDAIISAYECNGGEADYYTIYAFLLDKYAMVHEVAQMKKTVQRCVEDHCPQSAGFKGTAIFRHVAPGRYRLLTARESAAALRREPRAGEYIVPAGERVPVHRHADYVEDLASWFARAGYRAGVTMKKDDFCDLIVFSTALPRALLFEAKSACGPYDLYTAIGQLAVNKALIQADQSREVIPVLAFPHAKYSKRTSKILGVARDSGISIIHYGDFDAVARLENKLASSPNP